MTSCSGNAKPNKKARVNKPVGDPKTSEPEQQTAAPEDSVPPPPEPSLDDPPVTFDPPMEQVSFNPLNPGTSSLVKTSSTQDDDVVITNTGFREPGRPTVLAKHSAKEEHIERRKMRFYVANYSQLSIDEVYSGYLSQVNSSRDVEVEMVKQMHQKFEV